MAKLLGGTRIYGNATIDTDLSVSGNVTTSNITANVWRGIYSSNVIETAGNLYFTNTRTVNAVTNTNLSNITVTGNVVSSNVIAQNMYVGTALFLQNINVTSNILTGTVASSNSYSTSTVTDTIYANTWLNLYTANVVEAAGNLYYTNTRVYANTIALLPTLAGTGISISANGVISATGNITGTISTALANLTTANIAEAASNLYYTNARVYSNVISALPTYTGNSGSILTTSSQPYITTVGTLTNLTVAGNIQSNSWVGLYTSNVIETASNLYFTNARTINAITNTTLSNITISGNIIAGNLITGSATSNIGGSIVGANLISTNYLYANNIITGSVNNNIGGAITGANLVNTNYLVASNITANTWIGIYTANVIESNSNLYYTNSRVYSNTIALLPTLAGTGISISAGGVISATANVSGSITGALANLTTANITEASSNLYFTNARVYSNVLNLLPTYTGNSGSTLTTSNQPYITALGTLSNLSVTGNISTGNIITGLGSGGSITGGNLLSATNIQGNIWAGIYTANVIETASNLYFTNSRVYSNVISALPTYTGNSGSTLTTGNQPYITSLGTLANLTVTGNITAGNIFAGSGGSIVGGNLISTNNIQANTWLNLYTANVVETANNLYFTNTRAATAVVNSQLSNITVTGNVVAGNIITQGIILQSINVTSNILTGGSINTANLVAGNINASNILANYISSNTLAVSGNITAVGTYFGGPVQSTVGLSSPLMVLTSNTAGYTQIQIQNISSSNSASSDFVATANNGTDTTNYIDMGINNSNWASNAWTISGANDGYLYVDGGNLTLGTDTVNKNVSIHVGGTLANNIVATFAANGLTVSSNITTGNIITNSIITGNLLATSNIGGYIIGANNIQTYNLNASNIYTSNLYAGNIISGTLSSNVGGFIVGANLISTNYLFANILSVGNTTSSIGGSITGVNVITTNYLTASNITSNNWFGLYTANVSESASNLYFTNSRVYSNTIALLPTLAGTGISINANGIISATANVSGSISGALANLTTANISEAPSNLYYTNARVANYIQTANLDVNFGNITVNGNLYVKGNVYEVFSNSLYIVDKTITVAKNTPTATLADQSGLIVDGANASILYNYNAGNDKFVINKGIDVYNGTVNATNISATTWTGIYTANVSESASNLYFTNNRAVSAVTNTTLSNITVAGNVIAGNIITQGIVLQSINVTSNILTGGSVNTANLVAGNINASNILANFITSNILTIANSIVTNSITSNILTIANSIVTNSITSNIWSGIYTANVSESASNLYFTNARVYSNVVSLLATYTGNVNASNITAGNIITNSIITGNISASANVGGYIIGANNIQTYNLNASNVYTSNLYAGNIISGTATSNVGGFIVGANLISTNYLFANILSVGNTTSSIGGSITGVNTISATYLTTSNIITGSITSNTWIGIYTANVSESASNLYFTNSRVYSNVIGFLPSLAGTGVSISANGVISATANVSGSISGALANLTTANITEVASNLYFTNTRVYANIAPLLTTANIAEISSNLYFTNNRAATAIINTQLANITVLGNVVAGNIITQGIVLQSINVTSNILTGGSVNTANLVAGNVNASNILANYISSNTLSVSGNITAVGTYFGGPTQSTIGLANPLMVLTSNVNTYTQIQIQNINSGPNASSDFVATANNGTDTSNYIDMGINNSGWSSNAWTISGANDGYLYVDGGNLTLGTDTVNKTVAIHVGGTLANNIVATFNSNGLIITGNITGSNTIVTGNIISNSHTSNIWNGLYTANVIETSGNLYFTNARVNSVIQNYTGNLNAGNIITNSIVSGNLSSNIGGYITGANLISTYNLSASNIYVSNIYSGNIISGSATSNVGGFIVGANLIQSSYIFANILNVGNTTATIGGSISGVNTIISTYVFASNVIANSWSGLYTSNVIETAGNLFYSNSRVYSNTIALLPTLAGTGISISAGGVISATGNITASLSGLTTANIAEAASNLYYTNARAQAAISGGTGVTYYNANGQINIGQDVSTSANVTFGTVNVRGTLNIYGNVNTYGANNLSISDNMIYLNSNSTYSNPDLGFAGNYNDGTYHHAGFFRDALDKGTWKVFENYSPEPDSNIFINTSDASFRLANLAATTFFGNVTGQVSTISNFSTTNLVEGTNLYFTNTRVYSNVTTLLPTYTGNSGSILTTSAQPYITSLGTLTNLAVTGNISAGNILVANSIYLQSVNVTSNILTGGTINTNNLAAGNINANNITSNIWSNLYTANVIETASNLYFTNARVYSNVTSLLPTYTGNSGSILTTGNQPYITTLSNITVNGNLFATGNLITSGTLVANNISTGNVTSNIGGTISGANLISTNYLVANTIITGTANNNTGGAITGANLVSTNYLVASNITSNTWIGIYTANVTESASNLYFTNARAGIAVATTQLSNITVTGNVVAGNIITNGIILQSINVTSNILTGGSVNTANLVAGNVNAGNVNAGNVNSLNWINLYTANVIETAGNLYFTNSRVYSNVIALLPTYTGNSGSILTTGNQPYITTLSNITVLGVLTANNISTGNAASNIGGTISGANLISTNYIYANNIITGTANNNTGGSITGANLISTVSLVASNINVGNVFVANTIYLQGANVTGNILSGGSINTQQLAAGNINAGNITANGWIGIYTANVIETAGNLYFTNARVYSNTIALLPTYTGNINASNVIASAHTGNIWNGIYTANVIETAGNLYFTNTRTYSNTIALLPTYTGNINASNVITGNLYVLSSIYLQSANVTGNILSGGSINTQQLAAGNINAGNVTANGLTINGNITTTGIYFGGPTQSTIGLANPLMVLTSNVNNYTQIQIQNINSGPNASSDFIATTNSGTDTTNYIDMGINNSGWSSNAWTISGANDGYLYVNSGNLTLGTDTVGKAVAIHVGGTLASNIVATFSANGLSLPGNVTTSYLIANTIVTGNATSTIGGSLVGANLVSASYLYANNSILLGANANIGGSISGANLITTSYLVANVITTGVYANGNIGGSLIGANLISTAYLYANTAITIGNGSNVGGTISGANSISTTYFTPNIIVASGSVGTPGQVLASNGSGAVYWVTPVTAAQSIAQAKSMALSIIFGS